MLLIALCYWCFPQALISIDLNIHETSHAEIIHDAIAFFAIAALFQIFEATQISLFGALRALKDTQYTDYFHHLFLGNSFTHGLFLFAFLFSGW